MPSLIHEALVDLFRSCPTLAAHLLAARQAIPSPDRVSGELVSEDLSVVASPEYRADAVVRLSGPGLDLALVVEIQLRRDPDKPFVWPAYVAVARARHRIATTLLVLTLDADTARWAAEPIELGPGWTAHPIVIGPEQVPAITDRQQAASCPELAVLSAMAHGSGPLAAEVGLTAAEAARDLDEQRSRLYVDLILAALHPAARVFLERLMIQNWEPQSDLFKRLIHEGRTQGLTEGRADGRADGERRLLERQLSRRFGPLPADLLRRIAAASEDQLLQWSDDVLSAPSLEAIFGPP